MKTFFVAIFCAVCVFVMVTGMSKSEEENSSTTRRHPKDLTTVASKQRRDAEKSGKESDDEDGDEKRGAEDKFFLHGLHGHGHGLHGFHGHKRYRRDTDASTTKASEDRNKENEKIEGTTKRQLRQVGLHVTTEANKNHQSTQIKRQAIKESSTTPSGKQSSSSDEERKGRMSREADKEEGVGSDSDSEDEGTKQDDASRSRPLNSYRLRRQEQDGQIRRTPGVDHQRPTEETMRKERQTAPGAPGAPGGEPAPAPEDLSARRRPVRPRPPPPPPPPAQGGGTLTLPDGIDLIVSPINPGFTCDSKIYGYYADTFNDCKLFHVCVPITNERGDTTPIQWSFACGNQTLFNQELMTCDHKDNVDCTKAQDYYNLNENFGKTERPRI